MIPIRLELEAFGPFAKKQGIDFAAFDSEGIFLISGKTGSGKTSIFDAISFCLYGIASGDIRDADSFKSDFASRESICYVEFEFIVHGKRYIVRREPIQFKLKRNGNYVKENSTATLTLEDGSIINGTANVDVRVEEILGINADQFKKIVMLPQGEFRKFLSDDSNEKQKTLRKIFSTKVLDDFTEQLRMNTISLKSKLEQHITRCNAYIESIQVSNDDELDEAVRSENKDISYILRLLRELNKEHSKLLSTQKESLVELNQCKDSINIPYAKEVNSKFLLLENSKKEMLLLNAKKHEFDALSHSIELLKQIKEIETIEKSITEISTQETAIKENVATYKKAYEEYSLELDSAKVKLIDAKSQQSKLPSMITKIEELKQKLTKIDKLYALSQEFAQQQDDVKRIGELLEKLAKAQKYVLISGEIDNAQKQYDSFCKITSEILKCKELTERFLLATKGYKQKMNCFIESQAFFLSGSLKEDTPCPVCGSKEHPNPAKEHQETVSQDELESEKQIYDESSRRLKEQQTICNQLLINAEFDMKSHTKLSEFLPDIEAKTRKLQNTILELKQDLNALNIPAINLTLDEINNRLNSQNTAIAVAKEKLVLVQKNISEIQSENSALSDNPQDIKLEIQTLIDLINEINKTLENATNLKDRLSSEVERYSEAVNQQTSQLLLIAKNKIKKQAEFDKIIALKGLTVEEYNLKKADTFKLAEYEKSLSEYINQVTKYTAIVDSLTIQLKDLSTIDLEVLQIKYDEVLGKIAFVSDEVTKLSIILSTNLEIAKKLDESYLEWENLSITLNEYQRFYDIANGKFSDKINFERYVLASYFNDVIKNANIRLEQMTNSRYTLNRRTDKEKGNKSSGLALEVFDAYTGASRHVNTLSGGEGFKISLCLALGLADIISQNSGGIELNTMFIDEGFGSLDSASLDAAIECLNELKSTGRYIGIISHVSELQDKIPSKLFVVQEPQGSYIKMQE